MYRFRNHVSNVKIFRVGYQENKTLISTTHCKNKLKTINVPERVFHIIGEVLSRIDFFREASRRSKSNKHEDP